MARVYPTNAARGSATALTGAGSAADIFTFAAPVLATVQNATAANIYIMVGIGATGVPATQGDEVVAATTGKVTTVAECEWVAIYGAALAVVNGTGTGGIGVWGAQI